MEKQSEWNPIEKLIHSTLVQADIDYVHNKLGESYVRRLYKALKEAGYLNDTNKKKPKVGATTAGVLVQGS